MKLREMEIIKKQDVITETYFETEGLLSELLTAMYKYNVSNKFIINIVINEFNKYKNNLTIYYYSDDLKMEVEITDNNKEVILDKVYITDDLNDTIYDAFDLIEDYEINEATTFRDYCNLIKEVSSIDILYTINTIIKMSNIIGRKSDFYINFKSRDFYTDVILEDGYIYTEQTPNKTYIFSDMRNSFSINKEDIIEFMRFISKDYINEDEKFKELLPKSEGYIEFSTEDLETDVEFLFRSMIFKIGENLNKVLK